VRLKYILTLFSRQINVNVISTSHRNYLNLYLVINDGEIRVFISSNVVQATGKLWNIR